MLDKILQDNGFSEKEAKIYLATLELSNAPASSIARRVKENRVTVYSVLKNLVKRGMAQEFVKGKTTY
ncbi:helix-turn-helix domain-containing protein, partial [bacterium]|nr:helix-turn-helix domain-containing protein [bacterium]